MSSCLSGGARAYSLDLELVKSPASASSSARSAHSSSPSSTLSSTLSESSNSPHAISTRKPRTPRKRPNQAYTEAAALLAAIYPDLFSPVNLRKQLCKHTAPAPFYDHSFTNSSVLLPAFPAPALDNAGFLLFRPPTPQSPGKSLAHAENRLRLRGAGDFASGGYFDCDCGAEGDGEVEFDAGSILDEEVEEGLDSIMGHLAVADIDGAVDDGEALFHDRRLEFRFGPRSAGALRRASDDGEWWKVPTVDVRKIVTHKKSPSSGKTKKKKKLNEVGGFITQAASASASASASVLNPGETPAVDKRVVSSVRLGLKLSHDKVMDAWSDRSPYSDDFPPHSAQAMAKLAEMELSGGGEENGGPREASVQRYKEKRRTRLFSKKIRYQVRKVNADKRPRIKGRFIKPSQQH